MNVLNGINGILRVVPFSVQFNHSVMSDSL